MDHSRICHYRKCTFQHISHSLLGRHGIQFYQILLVFPQSQHLTIPCNLAGTCHKKPHWLLERSSASKLSPSCSVFWMSLSKFPHPISHSLNIVIWKNTFLFQNSFWSLNLMVNFEGAMPRIFLVWVPAPLLSAQKAVYCSCFCSPAGVGRNTRKYWFFCFTSMATLYFTWQCKTKETHQSLGAQFFCWMHICDSIS